MSLCRPPSPRQSLMSIPATRPIRTVGLVVVLVALGASPLVGQPPVLPRQVNRGLLAFDVTLRPGPQLGTRDGEGELGQVPWVACAGPGGPYFAATMSRPGRLIRFGTDGAVQGGFGRQGRGPGEFQSIYPLEYAAGRLFAFDGATRRLTVLTPELQVQRMIPLPGPPGKAVVLAGDTVLLAGEINTAELIGLPLHLVDTAGRLVRSFGAATPVRRPDRPYATTRRVAAARAGGVWSAHFTRYQIERWSPAGAMQEEFHVPAAWFSPWDTPVDGVARPTIVDIHEDREGFLWVLARVPRELDSANGARNVSARYDTIIEVIDTRAARVIATRRVEGELREFACERMTYRYIVDDEGFSFVEMWTLGLGATSDTSRR